MIKRELSIIIPTYHFNVPYAFGLDAESGDTAAGLGLHFLHMSEGPFSHDAGQISIDYNVPSLMVYEVF